MSFMTSPRSYSPFLKTLLLTQSFLISWNGTTCGHRCQEAESIVTILETGSHGQGQNPGIA